MILNSASISKLVISFLIALLCICGVGVSFSFAEESSGESTDASENTTEVVNGATEEAAEEATDGATEETAGETQLATSEEYEEDDGLELSPFGANDKRVLSNVSVSNIAGLECTSQTAYQGYSFTIANVFNYTQDALEEGSDEESSDLNSNVINEDDFNPQIEMSDDEKKKEEFKQSFYDFFEWLQYQSDVAKGKAKAKEDMTEVEFLSQENTPVSSASSAPSIQLTSVQADSIQAATTAIEDSGYDVGYVVVDLDTGNSISYNIDQDVYGASSFKGPYCTYVCDHFISGQGLSQDTSTLVSSSYDPNSYFVPYSYQALSSIIEATIVYSDNNAYRSLRNAFDGDFHEYLESAGIDSSIDDQIGSFPTYCARESAELWLNCYHYLAKRNSDDTAKWLTTLLENTEVSFIRNGVEQAGVDAAVMNKAGWNSGESEYGSNSCCDAGIIEIGNKAYLMSVMTNQPDSEVATQNISDLVEALLNARSALDSDKY